MKKPAAMRKPEWILVGYPHLKLSTLGSNYVVTMTIRTGTIDLNEYENEVAAAIKAALQHYHPNVPELVLTRCNLQSRKGGYFGRIIISVHGDYPSIATLRILNKVRKKVTDEILPKYRRLCLGGTDSSKLEKPTK